MKENGEVFEYNRFLEAINVIKYYFLEGCGRKNAIK
jgi:hypothetical protein